MYSDSLQKVRGVLARVMKASANKDRVLVNQKLTTTDYNVVDMLMKRVSMRETVEMYDKGQLSSLAAFWQGGVCWTRGRLGPSVMRLLGPEKLMIL